ncbi:hypothetical protein EJ07DRAFT_183162 [Lizonia empirigonia]|nr:hypothetical protein EJ07DRAFT_183162 [Lizonia empirigonia]
MPQHFSPQRTAPHRAHRQPVLEFTKPEDANRIIDEGLVWQGEVFQCERRGRFTKDSNETSRASYIQARLVAPNFRSGKDPDEHVWEKGFKDDTGRVHDEANSTADVLTTKRIARQLA